MSYRYYVGYRPERSFVGPFAQVVESAFGVIARAFWASRVKARENSAIKTLSGLDDRTLRDIGVPRSEIRPIARKMAENPGMDYRVMCRQ